MLLSATPHDGSARSFASLMSLLDPTAISDPDDYTPDDFRSKGLVIRRFKKDIATRSAPISRSADHLPAPAGQRRRKKPPTAHCSTWPSPKVASTRPGRQQELQRIGLQKVCSPARPQRLNPRSSASSCCIQKSSPSTKHTEVAAWKNWPTACGRCTDAAASFSKYQRLLAHLRSPDFAWQTNDAADRLVIFSERIETLRWLRQQLRRPEAEAQPARRAARRQMTDTEQQELVERFGRLDDPCASCCAPTWPAKA
jgi:hypothetical protein